MKLIGSKTEQDIRIQLIQSNRWLLNSENRLNKVLKSVYPEMRTAYTLNWIPEQGENVYTILINDSIIATIELDKYSDRSIVETTTVPLYLHGRSKRHQIQLAVALDLVKEDMQKY
ncbi:hypothetical protein [Chitinophaga ginsengisoli]|uniref:Uncharacterized protein n=1 Tax=Chitinophaga ginsengisoli TaxID=363837 RepID=A0A2P8GLD2_9BACT|nr:hypothetical protein [Chitinophaga ginsengisoli]PSL34766.1 hypothetical protein CLV42_102339 [Chitinophaga ginsengisoli]